MELTEYFKDVKYKASKDDLKRMDKVKTHYINSNKDIMLFLSSPHFYCYNVTMSEKVMNEFLMLFEIDRDDVEEHIDAFDEFDRSWYVSSDGFNLSVVYLMSLTYKLSDKYTDLTDKLLYNLYFMLAMKFLSGRITEWVNPKVDINIAMAVYENMHNSSLNKRYGSYYKIIEHLSKAVREGGNFEEVLRRGTNRDILETINGLYDRIYKHSQNRMKDLKEILNGDVSYASDSFSEGSGEDERMKDVRDIDGEYYNILKRIVVNPKEINNEKILMLVYKSYPRYNKKALELTLNKISELARKDYNRIERLIDDIVSGSINYIYKTKLYPPYERSLYTVLDYLRKCWSSSRINDEAVLRAKNELRKITIEATRKKTDWIVTNTAILIAIYLFTLAVMKNKQR